MNDRLYISVILPLKLEWEPCYAIPPGTDITAGDRVKVDFAGREYSGVVSATGIEPETSASRIKQIKGIETGLGRIRTEEIALWRSVAEYYMCSVGEVYKAAYPAGKINLEESHAAAVEKAKARREKILDGMRMKIERIKERLEKKTSVSSKIKDGTKAKAKHLDGIAKLRMELQTAVMALDKALEGYNEDPVVNLQDKFREVTLSLAQNTAYIAVKEAFSQGKPVLLHGVTGSGKTEIYIRLAQDALNTGKSVLYLVPEIALSRQLEERLHEHFGQRLLVFHSGESAAKRRDTAEKIDSKDGYIVLGTRSSLFLPHHDLGLIVVDEEHDGSYKQDSPAPRYNGRDTALMMSLIHKCSIVLGSATPSLEEIYNCRYGRHILVELTERFHKSEDSDLEIIDTRAERRKKGMYGSFSRKLTEHIRRTLSEGGQVMILRSRRSWAPALQCDGCGTILKCPHCNVSLSWHKTSQNGFLLCHSCGYRASYAGQCHKCGGDIRSLGAGTQKIEEEAQNLFPDARIARLDSDSARNKGFETQTIKKFGKGDIDILIGTGMIAKGFDFEKLSLVAVIAADTLLGVQDFRADEKAIQMLEQLRGRCGRRERKGLFIIQTAQPEHPVYRSLTNKTADITSNGLLMEREAFCLPPFSRIVEISIKDRYEDKAQSMADRLSGRLRERLEGPDSSVKGTVTGPYAPAISRSADMFIRCIRISLKKDRNLKTGKAIIKECIGEIEKANRYDGHITVNVDPL